VRLCVATAAGAGLGDDQAAHDVRGLGGEQQRRQPTERLTDDHHRAEPQPLHRELCIADVRRARDVGGEALAAPVPTRIERDDPCPPGQPPGRLGPLAGVAGQPVQQQDGRTVAAEVEPRETNPVSLEMQLARHLRRLLPRVRPG
jgi:hypothetical protein